jgi:hypothetical protein
VIRTHDFLFPKQIRYQLRHIPKNKFMRIMRLELILFTWKAKNLPLIYIRYLLFIKSINKPKLIISGNKIEIISGVKSV